MLTIPLLLKYGYFGVPSTNKCNFVRKGWNTQLNSIYIYCQAVDSFSQILCCQSEIYKRMSIHKHLLYDWASVKSRGVKHKRPRRIQIQCASAKTHYTKPQRCTMLLAKSSKKDMTTWQLASPELIMLCVVFKWLLCHFYQNIKIPLPRGRSNMWLRSEILF
jgi:hypothetical protein